MVPKAILKLAKLEAEKSTHRFRVGAVVYTKKAWQGRGYNDALKTHPRSPHPYKTLHAEFSAVLNTSVFRPEDLKGHSIYVHRLKRDGSPGLAKPCEHCRFMLSQVGITDIHYST